MGRERHSGIRAAAQARKTIDPEAGSPKTVCGKALRHRHLALTELVHAIGEYRTIAENKQDKNAYQVVREKAG